MSVTPNVTPSTSAKRSRSRGTVVGASLLAGAALFAGIGAFAAFSDTETATRTVDAGQLDLAVDGTFSVQDIAPGDIHSYPLTVDLPDANNDGDLVEFIRFDTSVNGTEVLGQHMNNGVAGTDGSASLFDGDSGLRTVIQNCVGGTWSAAVGNPGTFTCSTNDIVDVVGDAGGAAITGTSSIVDGKPVNQFVGDPQADLDADAFGVTPTASGTIPDGSTLNLLVTLALPGDNTFGADDPADNAYENGAVAIDFNLTAIQRAGIEK